MKNLYLSLLVAVMVVVGGGVRAQSLTTSAISGQVTSSTGEPLAGATVRAVHTPTGSGYGNVANAQGRFTIQGMRVGGPYTITVEYVGYQKTVIENIYLSLGGEKELPIILKEEGVALGTVEIATRRDALINSGRTGANTVITSQQLQTMPTLNRDLNSFLRFTPQSGGGNSFGGRQRSSNNYTLDGALLNDNFGLSGRTLPGEGSAAQPVSLDALDEVSVQIAPYDVRQFGFTGAGVALVTRGGTNNFEGSIAWFGQRGNWSRSRVAGREITLAFSERDQFVARVGGPIIKDKLFFHFTFETTNREIPGTTRDAREQGQTAGLTIANVSADSLRLVRDAVRNRYGFDVGSFGIIPRFTKSRIFTARFDWNISDNHKLSLRYNMLDATDDSEPNGSNNLTGTAAPTLSNTFSSTRSGGPNSVPFSSAFYEFVSNNNTVSLEWNSTFLNGKAQNQLLVTGSWLWSPQLPKTGENAFPMVEIFNREAGLSGQNATVFGTELFRQSNSIQQNQYLVQNNFSLYLGDHAITVGGQYERYFFNNRFLASRFGTWRFRSFDAFIRNINTPAGSPIPNDATPSQVAIQYDFAGRNSDAFVEAYRLGFYLQDRWTPYQGFTVTAGVRVDIPGHITKPILNDQAAAVGVRTDALPDAYVAWSPRVGLNWDVFKDGRLQVRGGWGIFTGNMPFVWMTNPVRETGLNSGATIVTSSAGTSGNPGGIGATGAGTGFAITGFQGMGVPVDAYRRFDPNVPGTQLYPTGLNPTTPGPGALQIAIVDRGYRYPAVMRSSFAVDYALNEDWVVSLDYAYTQDIDAVYFQNTALRRDPLFGRVAPASASGAQTVYYASTLPGTVPTGTAAVQERTDASIFNAGFNSVIRFANAQDGWSGFLTLKLEKKFSDNYSFFAAYTYTDSWAVTDGSGSQAASTWNTNNVAGPLGSNTPFLQPSSALVPHRFIIGGQYTWQQSKYTATTFSAYYEIQTGNRFSFRYDGDVNQDGSNANDLMYVPINQGDIVLVADASITAATPAQQWAQLNAFIDQDPYLSTRRGQFAERNGAVIPTVGQLDFGIRQDFLWEVAGRPNKLQISLDMVNVGNFINENWGVRWRTVPNAQQPLVFRGFNASGDAQFVFRQQNSANQQALVTTYERDPASFFSRFSIQFGVRYIWGR